MQPDPVHPIDLRDPDAVCGALLEGARANRDASCRRGSVDVAAAPGTLIASGDLHDNPLHLARLVHAAGLDPGAPTAPTHLTLHEIIHSDRLIHGMDFSYRALTRVAALKAAHPERVHVLLANHELSQVVGAGIVKDGVRCVDAFNDGLHHVFHDHAPRVEEAVRAFVRSMPLGLRVSTPRGDLLCTHSLPAPAMMSRFDPGVLERELTEADYQPRTGSAYMLVWGRGWDAEQLEDLVERWGVWLFIVGHDKAEHGLKFVAPNLVVLNSDHEHGVYVPIDLSSPPPPERLGELARRLAHLDGDTGPGPATGPG